MNISKTYPPSWAKNNLTWKKAALWIIDLSLTIDIWAGLLFILQKYMPADLAMSWMELVIAIWIIGYCAAGFLWPLVEWMVHCAIEMAKIWPRR